MFFQDSKLLFFPLRPNYDPYVNIISTFPNLLRLHLDKLAEWTPEDLRALPRSLTDLRVVAPTAYGPPPVLPLIEALPPNLECLTFLCPSPMSLCTTAFFEKLPPHLRTLIVAKASRGETTLEFTPEMFAAMPRSLTALDFCTEARWLPEWHLRGTRAIAERPERTELGGLPIVFRPEIAVVLPPYLAHLWIPKIKTKDIPLALSTLPERLEAFGTTHTVFMPKHLRLLPRGLKWLSCLMSKTKKLEHGDLPPALRRLDLGKVDGLHSHILAVLPPITRLNIVDEIDMELISLLPPSILDLRLRLKNADESVRFPPHLQKLTVVSYSLTVYASNSVNGKKTKKLKVEERRYDVCPPTGTRVAKTFPFHALPTTLRYLNISSFWMPISRIGDLPPLLRTLYLEKVFIDAEYDPSSPKMLAQARRLRDGAREKDDYNFQWNADSNVESISIFDLIPRTVTDLGLSGLPLIDPMHFKRVPLNLTCFQLFGGEALHPALLFHLPKASLTSLRVKLSEIHNHHVEALPRKLTYLVLHVQNSLAVTESCLKYYPVPESDFAWMSSNPNVAADWRNFLTEMDLAMADDSGNELEALLKAKRASWLH